MTQYVKLGLGVGLLISSLQIFHESKITTQLRSECSALAASSENLRRADAQLKKADAELKKENEELSKLLAEVNDASRQMLTQCERQNVLFRSCTANFRECTTRLAETQRADLR